MRLSVVLQADNAECGLACLSMVAGYHGHRETLREYRSRFRVSSRGTTLASLRDYAEQLGFQTRAVRAELHELPQLRSPAILHWEFNHFVVLLAVGRRWAKIADPAVGIRRIPLHLLNERFTGVALELVPTSSLTPSKAVEAVPLGTFLPAFRGLGSSLAGVFVMTLALQAFALALPLNVQFTIDQGVRQGDWNLVMALALGFGLVGFTSVATQWLRTLLVQHVGNTLSFRMVVGLGHHLLRLPDSWFVARHTGDVMSRFASTEPIRRFLMTGAFAMLVDAAMALGALGILLTYSRDLALALCVFLIVMAGIRLGTFGWLRELTRETIAAAAQEDTSFIENVERQRAIKLLGAEAHREDVWGERFVAQINAQNRLARFRAHVLFATGSVGTVQTVVILMLGAGKVIQGEFTLGMLFAFSSYAAIFAVRLQSLIGSLINLRMLRLHRERIADIAVEEREPSSAGAATGRTLAGRIEVRGVRFAYGDDAPNILEDFDFMVSPGEFVAIEGASGCGKSTFIKLLCRLAAPQAGTILVDGVELASLDTRHYRRKLGVVMQDDDLFSGNLVENIAVDTEDVDFERVEAAARLACLHDEIERLPMQYMTLVGHMGSTLSGGQRQRVMIARAFYREPAIILLDEGTAHLNDELQGRVLDNLRATGATIVAASHDERVLARADRRVLLTHAGR